MKYILTERNVINIETGLNTKKKYEILMDLFFAAYSYSILLFLSTKLCFTTSLLLTQKIVNCLMILLICVTIGTSSGSNWAGLILFESGRDL